MSDRGTGRTRDMVKAIPSSGGIVIVHNDGMRCYIETLIRDLRGAEVAARCKVHAINNAAQCLPLRGLRTYVAVDHAFYKCAPTPLIEEVVQTVASIQRCTPANV